MLSGNRNSTMTDNTIKLNYISDNIRFRVEPLNTKRTWMDETQDKYAYKCIPLTVVNQYGWAVYAPDSFSAEWDGTSDYGSVKIEYDSNENFASSHFGNGILTISVDFIVKTSESTSLFVSGPPNLYKDGIYPLSGIVETDWLPFTFTFNYKFTRPGKVRFEKEDPIFSFFPIQRGYIESFLTLSANIEDDEELYRDFNEYNRLRSDYLANNDGKFQKFYAKKAMPEKDFDVKDHIIKVKLGEFK